MSLISPQPVLDALLGTLFTYALTALGAAVVFFIPSLSRRHESFLLHLSLHFASGVMLAASYLSLLAPALEAAEEQGWGSTFSFVPVSVGFVLGCLFVMMADVFLPDSQYLLASTGETALESSSSSPSSSSSSSAVTHSLTQALASPSSSSSPSRALRSRRKGIESDSSIEITSSPLPAQPLDDKAAKAARLQHRRLWRRLMLVILVITIHNAPEGLAVGVAFGTGDRSAGIAVAIGIGIQNAAEGFIAALPLLRLGYSRKRAFFWGQLTGAIEPIFGVLGALLVSLSTTILPYALSFAAAAMIIVVIEELVPETFKQEEADERSRPEEEPIAARTRNRHNGRSSMSTHDHSPLEKQSRHAIVASFIFGFVLMMSLDCSLG